MKALSNTGFESPSTVKVSSRISRLNYGLLYQVPFVEGVHNPLDGRWDPDEFQYMAAGQTEWYLRRVSRSTTPSSDRDRLT